MKNMGAFNFCQEDKQAQNKPHLNAKGLETLYGISFD